MPGSYVSRHSIRHVGWLRAAVLGANDGIVSTAALIVGVEASGVGASMSILAGIAGLASGAMSMAAGEYVSVKSQADMEAAALEEERIELREAPAQELQELTDIYVRRGLEIELAREVAQALTARGALAAHARDELGITPTWRARPLQAAASSALAFASGAMLPLFAAVLASPGWLDKSVMIATVLGLLGSGALAARIGRASVPRGALRVAFWGVLAMLVSSLVGDWLGAD